MIQSISPSADAFLAAINQLEAKVARAQGEIGSGLRVNKPSDDPSVVSDILQINSTLARNTQIGQNAIHFYYFMQTQKPLQVTEIMREKNHPAIIR